MPAAPEWLDVEDVAALMSWSDRTARRRVAAWFETGAVVVRREATDSRKWRYRVSRASLDAYCYGVAEAA